MNSDIQDQVTKLVRDYYDEVSREHGITMQEVDTLFAEYAEFAHEVTIGVITMTLLDGTLSRTGGIGFKKFVNLFMKVWKLDGAGVFDVYTLLVDTAVAMTKKVQ